MEDEDGEHEAEPVLWPIRYGLAVPYMTDKYRTNGEVDLGLHGGLLLANRSCEEDEIQPLSALELLHMAPQPFLSANDLVTPPLPVASGVAPQEQLTHLLVQEAPGADFVPSVVTAAMGLGDSEEETSSSTAGLEDKSECMACVAPAAGFPAFLIFVTGLGRDTLNILFTMIIQVRAVTVNSDAAGPLRPRVAVTTANSCFIFSIMNTENQAYRLQQEKIIRLTSQPIDIAISHHTADLVIVTSNGAVHLWEASNPGRLRVIEKAPIDGPSAGVGDCVCTFGAHPRSLLMAKRRAAPELLRFDFATRKTVKSTLPLPSVAESVLGLARHPWHPFHLVITTPQHVLLFDERDSGSSLLAWRHHMLKEPPTLVTVLQPHPEQLSTYILVANRLRGEILFLQYSLGMDLMMPALDHAEEGKGVWDRTGQLCTVFSPERPIGLPSVFASRQYDVIQSKYTAYDPVRNVLATSLLPKLLLGLCAFVTTEEDDVARDAASSPANRHMEVFQMSEAGDIFVQMFRLVSAARERERKKKEKKRDAKRPSPPPLVSLMWDHTDAQLITTDAELWDRWEARFRGQRRHRPDAGPEVDPHAKLDRTDLLAYHIAAEECDSSAQAVQMAQREDEERLRDKLRDVIAFLRRGQKTVFDLHWHLKSELGLVVSPQVIARFLAKMYATKHENGTGNDNFESENESESQAARSTTTPAGSEVSSSFKDARGSMQRKDARTELFERLYSARPIDEALEGFSEFGRLLVDADRRAREDAQRAQRAKDAKARARERTVAKRQRQRQQRRRQRERETAENDNNFSLFPMTPVGKHLHQLSPSPFGGGHSPLPSPILPFGSASWAYESDPRVEPAANDYDGGGDDKADGGEDEENEEEEEEEEEEKVDYYKLGLGDLAKKWQKREREMRRKLNLPEEEHDVEEDHSPSSPGASFALSSNPTIAASPSLVELLSAEDDDDEEDPLRLDSTPFSQSQPESQPSQPTTSPRPFKRPMFPSTKRSASQSLIASQPSQGSPSTTTTSPRRLSRQQRAPASPFSAAGPPRRQSAPRLLQGKITDLLSPKPTPPASALTQSAPPAPPSPLPRPQPAIQPTTPNSSDADRGTPSTTTFTPSPLTPAPVLARPRSHTLAPSTSLLAPMLSPIANYAGSPSPPSPLLSPPPITASSPKSSPVTPIISSAARRSATAGTKRKRAEGF